MVGHELTGNRRARGGSCNAPIIPRHINRRWALGREAAAPFSWLPLLWGPFAYWYRQTVRPGTHMYTEPSHLQ